MMKELRNQAINDLAEVGLEEFTYMVEEIGTNMGRNSIAFRAYSKVLNEAGK